MMRPLRILLAASAAVLAIAGAPVQGQSGPATITFNDPNCGSWGMTQNGSSFTLTCQSLTCSISASPPAPLLADPVNLTANCVGASGSATYAWSKVSGPLGCPAIPASGNPAALSAAGATTLLCVYKVAATDGANGSGSATATLNWTATPPAPPSGCNIQFTTGSASMSSAGGPIGLAASCSLGSIGGSTTWAWTKNGAAFGSGTTVSDTLAANTGVSGLTTTYAVTVTNPGATPTSVTQAVTVAGTGGGGGTNIDMSACTAKGFTGRGVDMAYNLTGNQRVFTSTLGNFGNNDAIVIRFTTPAADTTGGASFTMTYAGGSPQVYRLGTLDTVPCSFGTAASLSVPAVAKSQGLTFNVNVGGGLGKVALQPNRTYYITIVNRNDYWGLPTSTPSCTSSTCDAYIDSN